MTITFHHDGSMLYLCRQDVEKACAQIDSISVIREVFALHGSGKTILPDEAYLSWTNGEGESVRSLSMPAYIGGEHPWAGTKIINGNISNPKRGLPRASGIIQLYDTTTTRILCIMDSAYISSLRTACVSALAIDLVKGKEITTAAFIGAGVLAEAHIRLLSRFLNKLEVLYIYDIDPGKISDLQATLAATPEMSHLTLCPTATAKEAICPAQLIIPTTTTTTGYIQESWLQPGSILINVSLDDPLPEVVFHADKVIVDDWNLVKNDPRRLLGHMYRAGQIFGPKDDMNSSMHMCRRIDAQLGELVLGEKVGRDTQDDRIFVNPFGLAIEDIALAAHVYQVARKLEIGSWLPR